MADAAARASFGADGCLHTELAARHPRCGARPHPRAGTGHPSMSVRMRLSSALRSLAAALLTLLTAMLVPIGILAVAPRTPALASQLPCQVPETDRHHIFLVNLDGDKTKERIDVFNVDAAGAPLTGLMVCDRVSGQWVRGQLKYIFTSPGARESGLRDAWAGDLNRDGRIEVAARDSITPSAGEVLEVLRQSNHNARTFKRLQSIAGDRVALQTHANSPATVTVSIKANHAADGRQHSERWTWFKHTGRWKCTRDCGGRP